MKLNKTALASILVLPILIAIIIIAQHKLGIAIQLNTTILYQTKIQAVLFTALAILGLDILYITNRITR